MGLKNRMNLQLFPGSGTGINRNDAEALIPEEVSREIIQSVPQMSAIMSLSRRLPDMTRTQRRLPILTAMARAYYVNGSGGLKKVTKQKWANKYIDAEEIAVIVPIPEDVLDDADYDIWGQIRPRIAEAFGIAFDAAVLYGTDGFGGAGPANWPVAIVDAATAAGHVVALGTNGDIYDDIMGENGTLSFVEEDGFNVTGHVAALTMKAKLRGLRDNVGQPLFLRTMQERTRYELDGNDVIFPLNGAIDPDSSLLISGAWQELVYSIRQDITYKILDQAVINDAEGNIIYNLAQQDMVALRAVMRLGWQLPNPVNRINDNEATRYPFAVLTPPVGP